MHSHFSALFNKLRQRNSTAGFSMIELMVSIGIIVLVLTITLTRQSSFNSAVLLRSEAFDIALAIREIQLSAVSAAGDGSGQFRSTLGVHLDTANPNEYILFRDSTGGNKAYDPGETIGAAGIIDPRFEISAIEAGGSSPDEVSVVFQRPNYDALFFDGSANSIDEAAVQITLRIKGTTDTTDASCGDQWRKIEITRAGQITVASCP
jgi:type II secretory pathway pseudopilin PulG